MSKVLKILNIVFKVMLSIFMGAVALLTLCMAYIMFAPDELPKPFRLVYQYQENLPGYMPSGVLPAATQVAAVPTMTPTVEVKPGEGLMVNMETKIINLSDPSGRKYIRLTVVLEFTPENTTGKAAKEGEDPNAEQLAAIKARMPVMDDVVITTLSTKSYDELYTANGKEALRKEIQDAINKRVPEMNVISVYFTEFVVQ